MDTALSGKTSQGRDVAYLVVINNWRGDQRDYKEKTRRPGGGGWGANHREQGGKKRKNNKIQLNASEQTHRATRNCSFVYANTRCQHINYVLSVLGRYSRTEAVFYRNPLTAHVTSTAHKN